MPNELTTLDEQATDRSGYKTWDTIKHIWTNLNLPSEALESIELEDVDRPYYSSSFKISHLAQSTIALSAQSAALINSIRNGTAIRKVFIPLRHSCLQFHTEAYFTINGKLPPSTWGPIGGLHATADSANGYVRIHDNFPHHRLGALKLLGLEDGASREDVSREVKKWKKVEFEYAAHRNGLAVYALRSFDEWDALPQSKAIADFPIVIRKVNDSGSKSLPQTLKRDADRCLRGLRVVELSRVIAAPVAGNTLASHGADVLWVTSPNLPDLPSLDMNLSRGKRSIQLDLNKYDDKEKLRRLIEDADVFIQGYRPGSLAVRGFSAEDLVALKPGLIYANLSAFGPEGPWSERRGFDSLVQTATGMNVSEAEHFGEGAPARPMPCQALDHAAGYLLATGICTALYKRAIEGGSWEVHVSLAGVMKYLRSLGQYRGKSGFEHPNPAEALQDIPDEYFVEGDSDFGLLNGLKPAPVVEGAMPGFDRMSRRLGSDEAEWL